MTGWWSRQSGPQRLDIYFRWGLYMISAAWPLLVSVLAMSAPDPQMAGLVAVLVLSIAQSAACIALLRDAVTARLGGPRPDRRTVIAAVALTAVGTLTAAWAFPIAAESGSTSLPIAGAFWTALLAAACPPLRVRTLTLWILGGVIAATAWDAVAVGRGSIPAAGVYFAVVAAFYVITYRMSVWMLSLVWEIDDARAAQAKLAVAEERLRFARDFHDVLGRNLTLIAVTSELAARLAGNGDPHAVDHMLEVHRVAHESAREVREVVAGYRTADLDAELAGARSVLRAAGIRVRVIGDGATFPRDAQAAFGWVLREATTNIIRHSAATACTIEIGTEIGTETGVVQPVAGDGQVRTPTCTALLRVRNDGARIGTWLSGGGTGLTGLRERLASVGGQLSVMEEAGGGFTVEARLPALAGAATTADSAP